MKQFTHPTPFLVSAPGEPDLYKWNQRNTEQSSISKKYPFLCIFFKRKIRNRSHLIGHLIGIEIYARYLTSYFQELLGWGTSSVSWKKPWITSTLNIWLLSIHWVALIVLRQWGSQSTTKYKSEVSTVKVSEYTIRASVLALCAAGRKPRIVKDFCFMLFAFSVTVWHTASSSQHSPTISQK